MRCGPSFFPKCMLAAGRYDVPEPRDIFHDRRRSRRAACASPGGVGRGHAFVSLSEPVVVCLHPVHRRAPAPDGWENSICDFFLRARPAVPRTHSTIEEGVVCLSPTRRPRPLVPPAKALADLQS